MVRYIVANITQSGSQDKLLGIYRQEGFSIRKVSEILLSADVPWASSGGVGFALSPDGDTLMCGGPSAANQAVQKSAWYKRNGDVYVYQGEIDVDLTDAIFNFGTAAWSLDSKTVSFSLVAAAGGGQSPYVNVLKKQSDGSWLRLVPDTVPPGPAGGVTHHVTNDGAHLLTYGSDGSGIYKLTVFTIGDTTLTYRGEVELTFQPLSSITEYNNIVYMTSNTTSVPVPVDQIDLATLTKTALNLPLVSGDTINAKQRIMALPTGIVVVARPRSPSTGPRDVAQVYWPYGALATAPDTYKGFLPPKTTGVNYGASPVPGEGAFLLHGPTTLGIGYSILQEHQSESVAGIYNKAVMAVGTAILTAENKISKTIIEPSVSFYNGRLNDLMEPGANVVKVMLVTAPFTFRENDATVSAAIAGSAEIFGNGWPEGGQVMSNIHTEKSQGLTRLVADSAGVTASGGAISSSKALIYDSTNDIPLAYIDLADTLTAADGERFSFEFDTSGIVAFVPV